MILYYMSTQTENKNGFINIGSDLVTSPSYTDSLSAIYENYMLVVGLVGYLYLSDDYGSTWTLISNRLPGISSILSVSVYENYMLVGGGSGKIFLSTDYGSTWTNINSRLDGHFSNGRIESVSIYNNYMLVGGQTGASGISSIFLSTDYGSTWTNIKSRLSGLDNEIVLRVSVHTNTMLAWGASSGIYISTNNGSTWTNINSRLFGFNNGAGVNSLSVYNNHILIGKGGGGPASINYLYLSTNNGSTWSRIHNRPNIDFVGAELSAIYDNYMLFSGGNDLYLSDDYGSTWIDIYDKLDEYNIFKLNSISIHDNYVIVTDSSAGNGVGGVYLSEINNINI